MITPKTIRFSAKQGLDKNSSFDCIILPFWKGKKKPEPAAGLGGALTKVISAALASGDFIAKQGEFLAVYEPGPRGKRILLLGLGDPGKATQESLRRAYGAAAKVCHKYKSRALGVMLPEAHLQKPESVTRGIAEGLLLANYGYTSLRRDSLEEHKHTSVEKVTLIGGSTQDAEEANLYATIAQGVYLARDLGNGNADDVTPQYLSSVAKAIASEYPSVKVTIFDKKRIAKEGMGLLLAVNRGSVMEPAFLILEYRGAPKSREHTVLVGKGVTYDTGGLSLKTTEGMSCMKSDMCGAAMVLGTILSTAALKLKINLTGVIPATDNCIAAASYKPGDVYFSHSGKSVEIGNTDAEGRLILADALSYAVKHLKPTRLLDFATLTGAMEISLGSEATGYFCNDEKLADSISRASHATFERCWRLPLFDEYREQLKSDVADIRNIGGRGGGAITAAKFLQEFVDKTPWAHFDIAGTAYLSEGKRYLPKYATGVGVRLMLEFLQSSEKG